MNAEKKVKKVKELFVQDLAQPQGAASQDKSRILTTLACGEEPGGCAY